MIDVIGRDLSGDDPDLRISALKVIPQLNPTVIRVLVSDFVLNSRMPSLLENSVQLKTALHTKTL